MASYHMHVMKHIILMYLLMGSCVSCVCMHACMCVYVCVWGGCLCVCVGVGVGVWVCVGAPVCLRCNVQ